jgi:hypothetical protein
MHGYNKNIQIIRFDDLIWTSPLVYHLWNENSVARSGLHATRSQLVRNFGHD